MNEKPAMDCQSARELLSASVDGQLDEEQAAGLAGHVASCADCRAELAALRALDADLARAFAPQRAAAAAVADRAVTAWASPAATRVPAAAPGRSLGQLLLAAAAGFLLAAVIFRPWQGEAVPVEQRPAGEGHVAELAVAELTVASGDVQVRPAGETAWQPLAGGGAVLAGHEVRTADDGRCELRTDGGTLVRLNSDTQLQFHSDRTVDVAQGQVWCCPASQAPLEVKANDVTLACREGTFALNCAPGETQVTVAAGRTTLKSPRAEREIEAGETVRVVEGEIVPRRDAGDVILLTRWINSLLVLKSYDDPELAEQVNGLLARLGEAKLSFLYEREIRGLGEHSVLPLTRYVQSPLSAESPARREAAMRILADLAPARSIPDLIGLLADADPQVRYHAATALERLTGQTQGRTPEQWRSDPLPATAESQQAWARWWQNHGGAIPACNALPLREPPPLKKKG